jgi:membrane protein YdbS with pleckstrin-like domain
MFKALLKKRVSAHIVEAVVLTFMLLIGALVVTIFVEAMQTGTTSVVALIVILLLLQLIATLGLIFVSVKIWEQHIQPGYEHKANTDTAETDQGDA